MNSLTIFETLLITHLVMDWIFQGHKEATKKATQPKYLLRHSLIYTLGFIPAFIYQNIGFLWLSALFISHIILDERGVENWILKNIKGLTKENTTPETRQIVLTGVDQTLHILILAAITLVVGS